jgi:hypothetical protein
LIGSVRELFVIPPLKVYGIGTPAFISAVQPPTWIPLVYAFQYFIQPVCVANVLSPHVHAIKHEVRFGEPVLTVEVDIEHELFTRCFAQSTVRDYQTLIDSIFMTVARGLMDQPKASHDTNTKLEAIAALYCHRNQHITTSFSAFCRVISTYRPIVPGVYAIGSQNTPDQGESPYAVKWRTARDPVKAHYVARLLFPELKGIVHPLYIPARTPAEYLKAFAKRMRKVGRKTHYLHGVEYDEHTARALVREEVTRILRYMEPRVKQVPILTPEEVLRECADHARLRFNSMKDIDAYIEGARIAMFEDRHSPLFQAMLDLCIEIGVFVKGEGYAKFAPLRYIMCPKVAARGFCHALLMNAQRRLFGVDDLTKNKFSVKHMTEKERTQYVQNLFGTSRVANGDITSMESTVNAQHMTDIELPFFATLAGTQDEEQKIVDLWDKYINNRYHVSCSEFELYIDPMRLSGQEHTSAGNWVVNFTWICSIIRMCSGQEVDLDKFRCVVEGDDSLYTADIPLEGGGTYSVKASEFIDAAESIGTLQKLQVFNTLDDASFCGILVGPSRRYHFDSTIAPEPEDMLRYDTEYVLSRVCWKVDYDRMTSKHDEEVGYATILSYLPRAVGNKELYDALLWLAKKHEPTNRQCTSVHFRNIWFHTFYRGEFDDVPQMEYGLRDYCRKFDLPYREYSPFYTPEVLKSPLTNEYSMEVEEVGAINHFSGWEAILNYFSPRNSRETVGVDERNQCLYHAVYEYLRQSNQLNGDGYTYDAWLADHYQGSDELMYDQIPMLLDNGQHIVVDSPRHGCEDISVPAYEMSDVRRNRRVKKTPCPHIPPLRVHITDSWFRRKQHAVLIVPKEAAAEKPIGAWLGLPAWLIVPFVVGGVCLLLGAISYVCMFGETVYDVPVYAWYCIIKRAFLYLNLKYSLISPATMPIIGSLLFMSLGKYIVLLMIPVTLCWWLWDIVKWILYVLSLPLQWLFQGWCWLCREHGTIALVLNLSVFGAGFIWLFCRVFML